MHSNFTTEINTAHVTGVTSLYRMKAPDVKLYMDWKNKDKSGVINYCVSCMAILEGVLHTSFMLYRMYYNDCSQFSITGSHKLTYRKI